MKIFYFLRYKNNDKLISALTSRKTQNVLQILEKW